MFPVTPTTSSMLSAYASLSTTIMLFQTIFNRLVPPQLQRYIIVNTTKSLKPLSILSLSKRKTATCQMTCSMLLMFILLLKLHQILGVSSKSFSRFIAFAFEYCRFLLKFCLFNLMQSCKMF